MASEVEICNLGLSHIGDAATVSSIDPVEASVQAEKCAQFYPMARDAVMELHPWNFTTRRAALVQLQAETTNWTYAYAVPAGMLNALTLHATGALDDFAPQDFVMETLGDGTQALLSNTTPAYLRFTVAVTDSGKFPPLVVTSISYLLASYLAGAIIKGDYGMTVSQKMLTLFSTWLAKAKESDTNSRHVAQTQMAQHRSPAMAARG